MVAGPLETLRLNNRTIYGAQGLRHIIALTNFGKTDLVTGKRIRSLLESAELKVGYSGSLFTSNHTSLSNCCTDTWISKTWILLWENNLVLDGGKIENLEIQILNNYSIMEYFLKEGLERNDLSYLNRRRLFLKATCILDISTWDGKYIIIMSWNRIDNTASYRYEWPTQPKPNQKIWVKCQVDLQLTYRLSITLTLTKKRN